MGDSKMYKKLFAIVFCALVANMSGCALTTDRIDLQYKPQVGITPIAGASKVTVSVQVVDQRSEKSKVSSKKNGYGMEMAPIIANEDVTLTLSKAIEQELRARGFSIGASTGLVQIAADLTRFYNDHKTGFFSGDSVADLNMSVVVRSRSGGPLYSKQIVAQGKEPNIQLMSGNNARLALNRALENGMSMLFGDQAFISALVSSDAPKSASN
jgi:uncharacterized lipoprotein YajG